MKFNASIDIAITISLVAVFLFANGQAHLGGYLGTFGVDPVLLNFSIQDKLYIGYLHGFHYLLYSIFLLLGYIVLIYIINTTNFFLKLDKFLDKKLNKKIIKIYTPPLHNNSFHERLDQSYKEHSFIAFLIMIVLIATLLLLANTETTAKDNAYTDLKEFDFVQTHLRSNPQNQNFFIIKCGSNYCALINKQKQITLEEPKNLIFSVREKTS